LNCCYGSGWFARLFWVMPCSIPPRLCFPVLVLPCTQKPVPSRNDGSFIFILNPFSLPRAASGVQRHLHRVADCIPGRQITRLRHNYVLAAGFFHINLRWETLDVPSL
ncbi:hypothetical protein B0H14DRAFT_2829085, partial [Mycena olivaceomarginata]